MRWPGGLRTRVIVAFVVVAMAAATAASGAGYVVARGSLIEESQQRATDSLRDQLTQLAPDVTYPPDQQALDRLRRSIGDDALVTFDGMSASAGSALGLVSDELRAAVATGDGFAVQRVVDDSGPKLVMGTSMTLTGLDGTRSESGVDVYVIQDLQRLQDQLDQWTRVVGLTIAGALPLAIALALLISRSVLRPIRGLRDSANQLAHGDLSTRLSPTGRDELADLATTFNHTAAELERSVGELQRREADARRFAGDVSHELRTPIMALTSLMEMLEADARSRSPDDAQMAAMAVGQTQKLARLAEDLLEISRLDAGAAQLRPEMVDVARVVADSLQLRAFDDGVELRTHAPVLARVDVRRLDVAVGNIVGNALRHGRPPVIVDVQVDGDDIVVIVTDHGPGIPDDVGPDALFARFYKSDASRSTSDGSGLGLSIALANARLHGGDLTACNTEGAGAQFTLRLPRRLDDDDPPPAPPPPDPAADGHPGGDDGRR
ncbi:sensor histidine kinase [Phytoactinopolyspora halotolerans]|uniref:histidine kinase n=1 Tax=Phytoactinopolyspora halotolerans TaxID=1981512 RepID=A0A6L9S9I1_9ACTN|nr:HAMP domain-containing sensor histidine kinase [Phytoactinopolyspora halotolerans]NEE01749.1 HAMP domain-containing histidine kinase [Phytoactinopolyspora halotolerans]